MNTKDVIKKVNQEDINAQESRDEQVSIALFPCGQEVTEGETFSFKTNTQQELIVHYKHLYEV